MKAALDWTEGYLARHGDENPRVSAQWLLSHATGLSRIQLYVEFERPLSLPERDTLRNAVQRRGAGEPLQYITGSAPFRYLTLEVRPGVLIPRPETEVLVSEALAFLKDCEASELRAADIGTGSGCIACSLVYEEPRVQVWACDVDSAAVELADCNVRAQGVAERVHVAQSDMGADLPDEFRGQLDLVISNPPYIPSDVLASIPREVTTFEPALALDGGADGLDLFRRLLVFSAEALREDGLLACELHEECLGQAALLAEEAGFCEIRTVKDLAGRPRVLLAKWSGR